MSKMANKSMIGAFVVGAVALAVIAVIVFGSGKFLTKRLEYVLYFQGSVKGLDIGSPVILRGVKIGEVKDISLQFRREDLTWFIPVVVEIDVEKLVPQEVSAKLKPYELLPVLIKKGLRAQLQSQSFVTGQLAVALELFPDKPVTLVGMNKKYHEIPTVPTTLEDLQKSLEALNLKDVAEKVKSTLDGIDRTINSPEIAKTLTSISEAAEEAKNMAKNLNSQLTPLASSANETVKGVQKLVQHVDNRIDPIASNAEKLLRNVDQKVNQVLPEVVKSLETLRGTLQEAQATLRSVNGTGGSDSPVMYQLAQTLEDVSNAAHSIRSLTDYVERHPESFIRGK